MTEVKECSCEEGFKKLGYHSFNEKDLLKQTNKIWNIDSKNIPSEYLVKMIGITTSLEVVGKRIFKLYGNDNEEIVSSAKCQMIYLSQALDDFYQLMKNLDSVITKQKEESDGWKSLSSFGNDES